MEAEEAACRYLIAAGYRILERNWRKPWGELDIVASRNGTVHFVEVKAASVFHAGFEPFRRAGERKMHKVARTARTWLSEHRYDPETEWQMDIVSVIMNGGPERMQIELFQNV